MEHELLAQDIAYIKKDILEIKSKLDTKYVSHETFDLTIKVPEVLGSLDPTLYTVNFYETYMDALINGNQITNPNSYFNLPCIFSTCIMRS